VRLALRAAIHTLGCLALLALMLVAFGGVARLAIALFDRLFMS
jgi:hypothetical protein